MSNPQETLLDTEHKLAQVTRVAESLDSICKEQELHIKGLGERCRALRVERDYFEREMNKLKEQLDQLQKEIRNVPQEDARAA